MASQPDISNMPSFAVLIANVAVLELLQCLLTVSDVDRKAGTLAICSETPVINQVIK